MSADATRAALDDIIAAFSGGDNDRLAARYDDDIDWLFHAPVSIFPFAGARRGKAEVFKGFALFYGEYKLADFATRLVLVDDDRAATLTDVHTIQRATGRTLSSRIAAFHRFHEGRLIEYRGFTDSFDAVEQSLGRELQF